MYERLGFNHAEHGLMTTRKIPITRSTKYQIDIAD